MVEFIGMIGARPHKEYLPETPGPVVDLDYIRQFAQAHEDGGFDRILIGYGSDWPDGWAIAGYVGSVTSRIGLLVAHRPGFVAPTVAARKAATLDHLVRGRLALHIITGVSDAEQERDGDFLQKDERYRRTDEYLQVVRLAWSHEGPFSYKGKYYRVRDATSVVRPIQAHLPFYFGGSSEAAIAVAAKQADTWAIWGEPLEAVREQVQAIRRKAAAYGREVGVSVSLRPILAATEAKARARAEAILENLKRTRGPVPGPRPQNAGSQRLLDFAVRRDLYDERLWTPLAAASNADGNSTALVGTPDQVAEALLAYVDAGVTTLLIRGYDPLEDAVEYGRDLLPLVRTEIARRERQREKVAV